MAPVLPPHVELQYLAEGAANVIYRVDDDRDAFQGRLFHSCAAPRQGAHVG